MRINTALLVSFVLSLAGCNATAPKDPVPLAVPAPAPTNSTNATAGDPATQIPSPTPAAPAMPDPVPTVEPLTALTLTTSASDTAYLKTWASDANSGEAFFSKILWNETIINDSGELNVCLRFDLHNPTAINPELVARIMAQNTLAYNAWIKNLTGYNGFTRKDVKLNLFGIAITPVVGASGFDPAIPQYINDTGACPNECDRFKAKTQTKFDFSACPQKNKFFDISIWFSDYDDFSPTGGSLVHGGDWGTRAKMSVALDYKSTVLEPTLARAVGNSMGLPFFSGFPAKMDTFTRPDALMVQSGKFENFDGLMIRRVWDSQKTLAHPKP